MEFDEPDIINKIQFNSNEITKNNILNYDKNKSINNSLVFNFDFSKLNIHNLAKNISLSLLVANYIFWGKLLPTGIH